jgi:CAAX prenyl protease-like protein
VQTQQRGQPTVLRRPPQEGRGSGLERALLGNQAVWIRRYLALLVIVELTARVWGSLPGAAFYAAVALLLVNHQLIADAAWGNAPTAVAPEVPAFRPVFLILAVAVVARLSALALGGVLNVWFGAYGLAALPMLVAVWRLRSVRDLPSSLPWGLPNGRQASVALAGVPLALAGFLAARPRSELDWWDLTWQLWLSVAVFALAGAVDEIVYQGFVRGALGSAFGTSGAGASAILYAVCHADVGLTPLAALVLANIGFGLLARRTGSLVGACIGHAALNVLLVLALPYCWPH